MTDINSYFINIRFQTLAKVVTVFQVFEHDCFFVSKIKDKEIQNFLEEATVMDPKFKLKMDDGIWDRPSSAAGAEEVVESQSVPHLHCDA